MQPVQSRIILRSLLLALGVANNELRGGTFAGMLRGRGAELRLAGEGGRVWVMALYPCDQCQSYHESAPIARVAEIDAFIADQGGPCPR